MPTGRPHYFRCSKCGIKYGGLRDIPRHLARSVHRTGKTKPTPPSGRGNGQLHTRYEYTCGCGHTGWSVHPDILRQVFDPPSEE